MTIVMRVIIVPIVIAVNCHLQKSYKPLQLLLFIGVERGPIMTFGQKLRELRETKGMSREALAVASGVSFGTIHGYEIDRRSPSLSIALKLAKALGVDCTSFADCEDLKPSPTAEPEKAATKKPRGKK
jgi:DNA-binding XRE family transcriptional regulator